MADLRQLADETAQALLESIKASASQYSNPEELQGLAEAYALVVSTGSGPLATPPISAD